MNRESFERQHADDWRRFEDVLDRLDRIERDRPNPFARERGDCRDFPELYRRVCYHLALARHRLYGTDLEQQLNRLVQRGHHRLYRRQDPGLRHLADLVTTRLPRRVRREARLFWLCFALFFGPLFGTLAAVLAAPETVYAVIDPETAAEYQEMYSPEAERERGAGDDVMMFGFYVYNNVSIAFRTFAGGVFCGVGSILVLLYNGVVIGVVAGHLASSGLGAVFFPFVIGHSSFELLAIVLAGVAGLKLGLALVAPARRRRGEALRAAGRDSLELIYGAALLLLLAAFVEAFWSSSSFLPTTVKYAAGSLGWAGMAAYFLFAGRGDGA